MSEGKDKRSEAAKARFTERVQDKNGNWHWAEPVEDEIRHRQICGGVPISTHSVKLQAS